MVAPYTVVAAPGPTSTYSFKTYQGRPVGVRISTRLNLSTSTLALEFDKNGKFPAPMQIGTVFFTTGAVHISMTANEVDLLGNGWYRVRVTRGTTVYYLVTGQVDYQAAPAVPTSSLLDENGVIRIELLPEIVTPTAVDATMQFLIQDEDSITRRNLEGVFLPRDEYAGAGGIDSATIQAMISTTLLAHEQAATPHEAYDHDIPSLAIIFDNKLI